MKIRNLKEDFDKKDITVTTVNWTRLQNMVNRILEKNGKDFYIQFSKSDYKFSPHDAYIYIYSSNTGEVIDDEQLSARYFPGSDVIQIFGGVGRIEQKSPEEVAESILKSVDYFRKEWSR